MFDLHLNCPIFKSIGNFFFYYLVMNNRTCFEHIKLLFGQTCYSYNSVMGGGEVMPH